MSRKIFAMVSVLLVWGMVSSFTTRNDLNYMQPGKWERIGSRKVNFALDRDVIHVGLKEGGFKKLKIVVTGGAINMHKMVVQYGDGSKDEIPLRHNFTRASNSRIIDLEGRKRVIRDITFWYDTKARSRRRATVHVYARH